MMRYFLKRVKYEIREAVSSFPFGVHLLSYFGSWRDGKVQPDSIVCIEGYPRSANTYAVAAYYNSQKCHNKHIGRHTHMVGQVKMALKYGVPTVIVVRCPEDAILSFKVHSPYLSVRQCLKSYIRFHKRLVHLRESFVVATFHEVTNDFQVVIRRMGVKYDLDVNDYTDDEVAKKNCLIMLKQLKNKKMKYLNTYSYDLGDPNSSGENAKCIHRNSLYSKGNSKLLHEANQLFAVWSDISP